MQGTFGPFTPLSFDFNGADSAQNNDHTATLLTTSSVLPPAQFPLYADSKAVAAWQRPGAAPFKPHDGNWFVSAGTDDQAYKRLLKTFTVPAGGKLKFDLVRPRAGLRLHVRRDPHGRGRRVRLDDARRANRRCDA